ncbi:uncharacterized protein LOC144713776 [Wolffia australiana]
MRFYHEKLLASLKRTTDEKPRSALFPPNSPTARMGTLVGHVAPGFSFLLLGLWHLLNNIKLYTQRSGSYKATPWFPVGRFRHLELHLIILGSFICIVMELFIGPKKGQPLDDDWTIPSDHLHNFEHASIYLIFLVYGVLAVALDRFASRAKLELTLILASIAFSQQFFTFRLHSGDHMGVEGQYHLLLQALIVVSLATTLMGVAFPESFPLGFVRSASIFFQGLWFIVIGFVLWTPGLVFKGCFMNFEEGHFVVRCHGQDALHRAKSLVNLQFSCCLASVAIFSVVLYLAVAGKRQEILGYASLETNEGKEPGAL